MPEHPMTDEEAKVWLMNELNELKQSPQFQEQFLEQIGLSFLSFAIKRDPEPLD
jgi:hypothetical protein